MRKKNIDYDKPGDPELHQKLLDKVNVEKLKKDTNAK